MWSPTAYLIAVTTVLLTSGLHRSSKKHLRRIQIYAIKISISLAILSESFIQIGYFFLRVMQENISGYFFSEHSV